MSQLTSIRAGTGGGLRCLIRRAAVAAGAAVMVLGAGVGVASASGAPPVLTWSQGGTTITSFD